VVIVSATPGAGLQLLDSADFRNLTHVKFEFDGHLNLVTGVNASGKTSVLEAIYYLARGRSFRGAQLPDLIRFGAAAFRIVATVDAGAGRKVVLGMERGPGRFSARAAGRTARSQAELASWLPVLLLTPDSHQLLAGGPRFRRQFLDWGCFHRDPSFLACWKRYQRAVSHRNAALRARAPDALVKAWDPEIMQTGQQIHEARSSYLEQLGQHLQPLSGRLMARDDLALSYRSGWGTGNSFGEVLDMSLERDRERGFTRLGPHRADFMVHYGKRQTTGHISRGQQKVLIVAMTMAQAELYHRQRDRRCVLLVDDLPAELDTDNRQRLLAALADLPAQSFVTSIDADLVASPQWHGAKVFELENGAVRTAS